MIVRANLLTLLAVASSAFAAGPAGLEAQSAAPGWRVETLVATLEGGTGGLSLAVDGTLYSSEFGDLLGGGAPASGTRVWAITPAGEVSLFADGFNGASGSAIDSRGTFFQSNIRGGAISRVSADGQVETFATEGIQAPVGIEVDAEDNLYVANCGSNSIQKITPQGVSTRFAESDLLQCPNGISRDTAGGDFYVANFSNGDVIKISPAGEASRLATLPGNNNGHLVYHDGSLYVAGRGAHQIFKLELDGSFTVLAGSGTRGADDGDAAAATFSLPNDIAVSPDGSTIYVNEVGPTDRPPNELAPTRIRRLVRDGAF